MREKKGRLLGLAGARSRPVGLGLLEPSQRWPGPAGAEPTLAWACTRPRREKGSMGLKLGFGP